MLSMTPLQSWSTLILVFALVLCLVCLFMEFDAWLGSRARSDSTETPNQSITEQGPSRIYDWSIDGL